MIVYISVVAIVATVIVINCAIFLRWAHITPASCSWAFVNGFFGEHNSGLVFSPGSKKKFVVIWMWRTEKFDMCMWHHPICYIVSLALKLSFSFLFPLITSVSLTHSIAQHACRREENWVEQAISYASNWYDDRINNSGHNDLPS